MIFRTTSEQPKSKRLDKLKAKRLESLLGQRAVRVLGQLAGLARMMMPLSHDHGVELGA